MVVDFVAVKEEDLVKASNNSKTKFGFLASSAFSPCPVTDLLHGKTTSMVMSSFQMPQLYGHLKA